MSQVIDVAAVTRLGLTTVMASARQHWRQLLSWGLPLPLVVGVMTLLTPREYSISAAFIPQEPPSAAGGLGAITNQLGLGAGRVTTGPQFYADLLSSKSILREVVEERFVVDGFTGTLVDYYEVTGDSLYRLITTQRLLDEAAVVTTNRATGVVRIEYSTRNPALTLAVVRRFLSLLNDFNVNRRQSTARSEREFLERRLALARAALEEAEDSLAAFDVRNRSVAGSAERSRERVRIERRVNLQLTTLTGVVQQLEVARTDEIRNTPVVTLTERPEDTLQPKARGTVRRVMLAGLAGLMIAIAIVFGRRMPSRTIVDRAA